MSGTSLDAVDVVVVDLSILETKENKPLFSLVEVEAKDLFSLSKTLRKKTKENKDLFCLVLDPKHKKLNKISFSLENEEKAKETKPLVSLVEENLQHYEHPYPETLKKGVLSLQTKKTIALTSFVTLEKELTHLYADAVESALKTWGIEKSSVVAVCIHGQTVFHQADKNGEVGTLQLGDASRLAETLRMRVIADFRRGDIAQGGQGAPLLPFYDALRFSEPDKTVVAHNLGGICNVSVLPAESLGLEPFAFDTGPANLWIDRAMLEYFDRPFDEDAQVARQGNLIRPLMTAILCLPYFAKSPPKSTGRDDFSDKSLFSLVNKYAKNCPKEDVITTLTHVTASSMAIAYKKFIIPKVGKVDKIVFSGGGVCNQGLMNLFGAYWQAHELGYFPEVYYPEDFGIPNKAKEALGFAWLGWAKWHGLPNNLPSCTGANAYVSGGVIY